MTEEALLGEDGRTDFKDQMIARLDEMTSYIENVKETMADSKIIDDAMARKPKKYNDKMVLIQAQSAGFQTGDFAIIKVNNQQHMFKPNDKGTYRGMHVCILNGKTGNVMWSEIFDTYHSSDAFEYFCSCELVEEGQIVIAACRDDAAKNLSMSVRQWFKNMGSKEIFDLKYRESYVFIG